MPWRLLTVHWPSWRLVPAELSAALSVTVWCARIPLHNTILSTRAWGKPLWNVLVVSWWTELVWAAAKVKAVNQVHSLCNIDWYDNSYSTPYTEHSNFVKCVPPVRNCPLQLSWLSHNMALAAYHSQFGLVRWGQVNGTWWDGWS